MLEARDADWALRVDGLGIEYRHYKRKSLTLKEAATQWFRTTSYESFWALRNVSFEVPRGQSLAVIGSNGSGKSTLLKAISRVLSPTEGIVESDGKIAPLLELGGGFNPELTGRENIYLNAAIMGLDRSEVSKRERKIIEFSGLEDFIDIPMHNYSSGMRSRLGFAVATEVDADILLLDEILAVGDASFRARAMERTKNFFESHRTVVLVSHSMEQIRELCSRVIWIHRGRLQMDGEPDNVIEAYLENTVA